MRKMQWGVLLGTMLALPACGGGSDAGDQAAMDTAAAVDTAMAPAADATAPAPAGNVQLPPGVTPEMVAQGHEIFNSNICWSCHQQNAVGGPLAPALDDSTWINIDGSYDAIVGLIKSGVPQPKQHPTPMPPMGGAQLTDQQIKDLAAYVYSISHGA